MKCSQNKNLKIQVLLVSSFCLYICIKLRRFFSHFSPQNVIHMSRSWHNTILNQWKHSLQTWYPLRPLTPFLNIHPPSHSSSHLPTYLPTYLPSWIPFSPSFLCLFKWKKLGTYKFIHPKKVLRISREGKKWGYKFPTSTSGLHKWPFFLWVRRGGGWQ